MREDGQNGVVPRTLAMDLIHLLGQTLRPPQPIDGIGDGCIGEKALIHQFPGRVFDAISDSVSISSLSVDAR